MLRRRNTAGFTMIELMIVIVVIGIIAAIAWPNYTAHVRKSRRSDAQIALTQLANAQEKFYLNCNSYTTYITVATSTVNTCTLANSGLGYASNNSPQGYYTLSIPVGNTTSYTITATATGAQAADSACPSLSLTSTGVKTPTTCWK